jgi:hypothetical protein
MIVIQNMAFWYRNVPIVQNDGLYWLTLLRLNYSDPGALRCVFIRFVWSYPCTLGDATISGLNCISKMASVNFTTMSMDVTAWDRTRRAVMRSSD